MSVRVIWLPFPYSSITSIVTVLVVIIKPFIADTARICTKINFDVRRRRIWNFAVKLTTRKLESWGYSVESCMILTSTVFD